MLQVDQYPLPRLDEIFAVLAGGKLFSKLDLSRAYHHATVDEKSSQYLTLNTHKGLYRAHRLAFGMATEPAVFQQIMDTMLKRLPGVVDYIGDILVVGKTG